MTTLHLVRHGETDWNKEGRIQGQTNSQLTDLGVKQARDVAEQLKTINFRAAYASSSIRARDTAQRILEHHNLALNLRDDMREINLGHWEGQLYKDMETKEPEHLRNFRKAPADFNMQGAETFLQVQERGLAMIKSILGQHPNQHVLLVSHGIWIRCILAHFDGIPLVDFWQAPRMPNCGHSIIEFNQDHAKIVQYAGLKEW